MKTFLYMAALTGLFILPSCLKNNTATPANAIKFPTAQGDYWVYKVTNYQNNTVDTVTVSVVGSIKDPLQQGNLTILQLKWPDKIDSQYVSIVNDTLAFYTGAYIESEDQIGYFVHNFIVYPFPSGKSYTSVLMPTANVVDFSDTVRMISSQSVDINLNKVPQNFTAFHEEKIILIPNSTPVDWVSIITDDFVPGIGIIKETIIRGMVTSALIETWELLNCHIDDPPSSGINP